MVVSKPIENPSPPELDEATREELLRRRKADQDDKSGKVPAREFLEGLLKKPADSVQP